MESLSIGSRIKRQRELKNLTQEFMANRMSISQNAYSKIENGGVKLTVERLIAISEILEIPVDELVTSDAQSFTFNNSNIDKFYGYIESLHEDNKEIINGTIAILSEQLKHLQMENQKLIEIISELHKNK
jgi:transcriptional regulator with XRE-family HTH domain